MPPALSTPRSGASSTKWPAPSLIHSCAGPVWAGTYRSGNPSAFTSAQAAPTPYSQHRGGGRLVEIPADAVASSNTGTVTVGAVTSTSRGVPTETPSIDAPTWYVPSCSNHCEGVNESTVLADPYPGIVTIHRENHTGFVPPPRLFTLN